MAGDVIKEFLIGLGVDPDTKELTEFDRGLQKVRGNMRSLVKVGAAAATAVAGFGTALFTAGSYTAGFGDTVAKTSQEVGMTTQHFQEMRHAAELAAVDLGTLRTGVRRASRNFKDFVNGEGEARDAIAALGIQATDSEGNLRPMIELVQESAGAFAEMENETRKVALANEIFGRSGAKLLPLFNQGAEGFAEMRQEAHDLGIVMDDEVVQASARWQDQLLRVERSTQSFVFELGARVIPLVNEAADAYIEWAAANREVIERRINEFMDALVPKLKSAWRWTRDLASTADDLAQSMGGWAEVLSMLTKTFTALSAAFVASKVIGIAKGLVMMGSNLGWVTSAATALWGQIQIILAGGLGSWLAGVASAAASAAGPIAAVLAALAGLAVVVQDVQTYMEGGDSLTGRFIKWFKSLKAGRDLLDGVQGSLEEVKAVGKELIKLWPYVRDYFIMSFRSQLNVLSEVYKTMIAIILPFVNLVVSQFEQAFRLVNIVLLLFQGKWGEAWKEMKAYFWGQIEAIWDFWVQLIDGLEQSLFGWIGMVQEEFGRLADFLGFGGVEATAKAEKKVSVNKKATVGGARSQQQRMGPTRQSAAQFSANAEVQVVAQPGQSEEEIARIAADEVERKQTESAKKMYDEWARGAEE